MHSAVTPGRLSTAASVCEAHGKDESYHAAIGPDAVVFPTSTAEVSQARVPRVMPSRSLLSDTSIKKVTRQLHRLKWLACAFHL